MSWLRKFIRRFFEGKKIMRELNPSLSFKVNLEKDPEDIRDMSYAVSAALPVDLPKQAKLKGKLPEVKNQGNIGSCASHAFASCVEYLCNKNDRGIDDLPLSELFHYYVVRGPEYMDTYPEDTGQYLREGAKVLKEVGIAPEALWPYYSFKYNMKPGWTAYGFAGLWKIKSYNRVWSLESMKTSIRDDIPVVFGIKVSGDSFKTPKDGELRYAYQIVGGHALLAIEYDDERKNADGSIGALRFENSWDKSWGDNGFGWISYDRFRKYFMDAWTVTIK